MAPRETSVSLRTLINAALVVALAACGGDGGGPTGPAPRTVGPDGGTFTFDGGKVTLVFPAGAVSQSVNLTVESTTSFPSDERVVGGSVYDFGPNGISFNALVRLTIRYEAASLPAGIEEPELRIYEVAGGSWQEVSGSVPNSGGNSVAGSIDGFSAFGALGVPVGSIAVAPDSGTIFVGSTLQLTATDECVVAETPTE